jgi:prepilin-type N-terminal cleavage/methylation domain-containing protein
VRGYTLLEVLVVLAIMGIALGVSGLALASLKAPREAEQVRQLRQARERAIQSGGPVFLDITMARSTTHVLFLPDGRAIGPGLDPFTGFLRDSAR